MQKKILSIDNSRNTQLNHSQLPLFLKRLNITFSPEKFIKIFNGYEDEETDSSDINFEYTVLELEDRIFEFDEEFEFDDENKFTTSGSVEIPLIEWPYV